MVTTDAVIKKLIQSTVFALLLGMPGSLTFAHYSNSCPDAYIQETNHTLQFILENDFLLPFREDLNFQGLQLQDFQILSNPDDSNTCYQISSKGFYPETTTIPVGKTYYKVNNKYVVLVRFFYDDPYEDENGVMAFPAGPSWAIAIYDEDFEVLHSILIL